MLDLPREGSEAAQPIAMPETTGLLDTIIRAMYPSTRRPTIRSGTEAVTILRVLDKYQISNWPLENAALSRVGTIKPSIRAWALALQLDHDEARALAVRQFMADGTTGLEGDFTDLKEVDAHRYRHIIQIKQTAIADARVQVEVIINSTFCNILDHRSVDIITQAKASPFDESLLTENMLSGENTPYQGGRCSQCRQRFATPSAHTSRVDARRRIKELMESAVLAESRGVGLHMVGLLCSVSDDEASFPPGASGELLQ